MREAGNDPSEQAEAGKFREREGIFPPLNASICSSLPAISRFKPLVMVNTSRDITPQKTYDVNK